MNRLIIIGNGFDLAHGLPTSYRDFIDDYWSNLKNHYKDNLYQNLLEIKTEDDYFLFNSEINNFEDFTKSLKIYCKETQSNFYEQDCVAQKNGINFVYFKNLFFLKVNNENSQNWVDIENLYYSELKRIVKSKCLDISKTEEYWKKQQKKEVEKLNEEFEQVKNLLEKYLLEKVLSKYEFWDYPDPRGDFFLFAKIIKPISKNNNEKNLFKEFQKLDHPEIESHFSNEEEENNLNKLILLNFNYTSTILKYLIDNKIKENYEKIHIPIHGIINDKAEHKINFGFGDEMDEDYKLIENINDNEYLRNFKSFQYLQNSNYRKLLNLIETENFQVYIMGHSCGLSDRTLLNTIFEHNNCRSIKVFYHQKEDGSDNYTEITQNISRHFNKKKLMREKIVNKTLCQPLPQIQLPKKK